MPWNRTMKLSKEATSASSSWLAPNSSLMACSTPEKAPVPSEMCTCRATPKVRFVSSATGRRTRTNRSRSVYAAAEYTAIHSSATNSGQ